MPHPQTRPHRKRGAANPPLERRYNFSSENLFELALLAGLQCPNCSGLLVFDGRRVRCSDDQACSYSWRSAESAANDIFCGLP